MTENNMFSIFQKREDKREDISNKIDKRLIKKTQTLTTDSTLSAIVFCSRNNPKELKEYLSKSDIKIKYDLPFIHAYAVEFPSSELMNMARSNLVKYVSDDANVESLLDIATQEVGSRIANTTGYTGKSIGIAVLDTGVYPHSDLTMPRNRIIAFKDFVNGKRSAYDDNGHGTFISGVAAGNGYASRGKYTGVAPNANIIGIKVMNSKGQGNASDILAGMQWVVDNQKEYDIRIMSLSLGSSPSEQISSDPLVVAVGEVWKRGIVVLAAAGNSGPKQSTINSPGISSTIITVGAADDKRTTDISDDVIADFSSRGPVKGGTIKPDVVAPGVNIVALNTDKDYISGSIPSVLRENYRKMSGTSVSTPMVSGLVALILEKYPDYTPDKVKESLMQHARTISNDKNEQGSGLVQVRAVLGI